MSIVVSELSFTYNERTKLSFSDTETTRHLYGDVRKNKDAVNKISMWLESDITMTMMKCTETMHSASDLEKCLPCSVNGQYAVT